MNGSAVWNCVGGIEFVCFLIFYIIIHQSSGAWRCDADALIDNEMPRLFPNLQLASSKSKA